MRLDESKRSDLLKQRNNQNNTCLYLAIENNSKAVVEFVVEKIREEDKDPYLVHLAARRGFVEILELLYLVGNSKNSCNFLA